MQRARQPADAPVPGEGPAAEGSGLLGGGEQARGVEDGGGGLHGQCLRPLRLALDGLGPQVGQHLGDVDLDGAGVVAGPAQGGGERQRSGVLHADELRGEDGADRSGVDGAVGVAAGALEDGADVEAGRAADAAEDLASDLVGEGVGAAVVEQHQVELRRAVVVGGAGPGGGVRVHPLAGGGTRQQLEEDLQVAPGGDHLLDAHDGDEGFGQGEAHAAVALGLHDHDGAGVGDGEVGAGDGHLGGEELLPQVQPGGFGEFARVVAEAVGCGLPPAGHFGGEEVADLAAVLVDRGDEDVGGPVVAELDDEFGEVGLVGGDPGLGEGLVEADLLRGHRLDLHHLALAGGPHEFGDDAVGLGGVARPVHSAARRDDGILQLDEIAVEVT